MTNSRKQYLRAASAILFLLLHCSDTLSLSWPASHTMHFFGLPSFLREVRIAITLLAQDSHGLNVLAAEDVHDY